MAGALNPSSSVIYVLFTQFQLKPSPGDRHTLGNGQEVNSSSVLCNVRCEQIFVHSLGKYTARDFFNFLGQFETVLLHSVTMETKLLQKLFLRSHLSFYKIILESSMVCIIKLHCRNRIYTMETSNTCIYKFYNTNKNNFVIS